MQVVVDVSVFVSWTVLVSKQVDVIVSVLVFFGSVTVTVTA